MKNKAFLFRMVGKLVPCLIIFALAAVKPVPSFAQDGDKPAKARLGLHYKTMNGERQLVATVKTKVDRSYEVVPGVTLKFYHSDIVEANLLGESVTNEKGEAILKLPEGIDTLKNEQGRFSFFTVLDENDDFRSAEQDLEVADSRFTMKLEVIDSVKTISVVLEKSDSAGMVGVEEANIKFFVKRMFGKLEIGEGFESTDEDGQLNLEFPTDIRGDAEGNITIIAELQDSEDFGTLIRNESILWGIPTKSDPISERRELWSARANVPIYLLVIVNVLLIGIWGTILYIFVQLFKIKKLSLNTIS